LCDLDYRGELTPARRAMDLAQAAARAQLTLVETLDRDGVRLPGVQLGRVGDVGKDLADGPRDLRLDLEVDHRAHPICGRTAEKLVERRPRGRRSARRTRFARGPAATCQLGEPVAHDGAGRRARRSGV